MADESDDLTERKLLQLLEAIEAVLCHDGVEDVLGADMLREFAGARTLVQDWLLHKSPMTLEQRLRVLQVFAETLARGQLEAERRNAPLH